MFTHRTKSPRISKKYPVVLRLIMQYYIFSPVQPKFTFYQILFTDFFVHTVHDPTVSIFDLVSILCLPTS